MSEILVELTNKSLAARQILQFVSIFEHDEDAKTQSEAETVVAAAERLRSRVLERMGEAAEVQVVDQINRQRLAATMEHEAATQRESVPEG